MGPVLRPRLTRRPTPPPDWAAELPVAPPPCVVDDPENQEIIEEQDPEQIDTSQLQIESSVGTGGTAEVFRGMYRGHTVAIKQLFRHRKMDAKETISFNREVAILARITHPNLVRLFGVTFKERPLRIVTEFCEGGTCFELLHNGPFDLTWRQQHKVCADTAFGMDYLHSFKPMIIHRDLKSLNLLLGNSVESIHDMPVVKVADFGLGRMKEPGKSWGKMTSQVGTLHWMAPEVFAGSDYDESVDIYSYAMVVFEVVCKEVPFEHTDPGMIGSLTMRGVRPDLTLVPLSCPKALSELMVSCWAQDARTRPPFRKIAAALRAMAPEASAGARPH